LGFNSQDSSDFAIERAAGMGTVKDEEGAREMVRRLHAVNPGQYFAFDQSTQAKRTIKPKDAQR